MECDSFSAHTFLIVTHCKDGKAKERRVLRMVNQQDVLKDFI
jgi:hypothetical protein